MNKRTIENAIQIRYGANIEAQELIFLFYFGGDLELYKAQSSPFRPDENPSISVLKTNEGTLIYHDFSRKKSLNAWQLPCESRQIPYNWDMTCRILSEDLKLGLFENDFLSFGKTVNFTPIEKRERISPEIGINTKDYTLTDYNYWTDKNKLQIQTLLHFQIYSCYSALFRFGLSEWSAYHIWSTHDPMYAYYFVDQYGKPKFKLLRPNALKKYKWRGNVNETDKFLVQGYRQLPECGDVLFVTSSLKDVATIYEAGFPAIAAHGEGYSLPIGLGEELKQRFKKVVVLYDNDNAGRSNSARILTENGFNNECFVPIGKDPTEHVIKTDKQTFANFLLCQI